MAYFLLLRCFFSKTGGRVGTRAASIPGLAVRAAPVVPYRRAVRTVQDDVNHKRRLTLAPGQPAGQPTETVVISRYRSAEFRRWLQGAG